MDEQTSKGLMRRDIGLGYWLFDFDLSAVPEIRCSSLRPQTLSFVLKAERQDGVGMNWSKSCLRSRHQIIYVVMHEDDPDAG
ncbi:MAG: hypothetical protein IPM66_23370 [Acidobacteriota bacterium]|nr:MAG: hypothetical protein IPM66_23370 [Acidobacteriota bacterium]